MGNKHTVILGEIDDITKNLARNNFGDFTNIQYSDVTNINAGYLIIYLDNMDQINDIDIIDNNNDTYTVTGKGSGLLNSTITVKRLFIILRGSLIASDDIQGHTERYIVQIYSHVYGFNNQTLYIASNTYPTSIIFQTIKRNRDNKDLVDPHYRVIGQYSNVLPQTIQQLNNNNYNTNTYNTMAKQIPKASNDPIKYVEYFYVSTIDGIRCSVRQYVNLMHTMPTDQQMEIITFDASKQKGNERILKRNRPGMSNTAAYYICFYLALPNGNFQRISLSIDDVDEDNGSIKIKKIGKESTDLLLPHFVIGNNLTLYDSRGRKITDFTNFRTKGGKYIAIVHFRPNPTVLRRLVEIDNNQIYENDPNLIDITPYIFNNGVIEPELIYNERYQIVQWAQRYANIIDNRRDIAYTLATEIEANNDNYIDVEVAQNPQNNNNFDYQPPNTEIELPDIIRQEVNNLQIVPYQENLFVEQQNNDVTNRLVYSVLRDLYAGLYVSTGYENLPYVIAARNELNNYVNNNLPMQPLALPIPNNDNAIDIEPPPYAEVELPDQLLGAALNAPNIINAANNIIAAQQAGLGNNLLNYNILTYKRALIGSACAIVVAYGVYLLYGYKGSYANILIDTINDWVNEPKKMTKEEEINQAFDKLLKNIKTNIPESDLLLPESIPIKYVSTQISTVPSPRISISQAYEDTAQMGNVLLCSASIVASYHSPEPGIERIQPTQLDHLLGPVTSQALGYVSNAMMPLPNTPTGLIEPVQTYRPRPLNFDDSFEEEFGEMRKILKGNVISPVATYRQEAPWKVNYNKNEPIPTSTPLTPTPTPDPNTIVEAVENKDKGFKNYISNGLSVVKGYVGTKLIEGLKWSANQAWEAFKGTTELAVSAISGAAGLILAGAVALVGYLIFKNR